MSTEQAREKSDRELLELAAKPELEVVAWITRRTKDGKQRLEQGTVATNPEYVKAHRGWEWESLTSHAAALSIIESLRAELQEAQRDAGRWRLASTSRNFGISFWGEHGQGVLYDRLATERIDAAIATSSQGGGK